MWYNNSMEKTLIIIVDVINGFTRVGALADKRCEGVIEPIRKFLDARGAHSEVIFFADTHAEDAGEFKFFPPHCHTEEESAVVDELQKYAKTIIGKNSTNGFFELQKYVDPAAYGKFVIAGLCTDICVLQLALTLRAYLNENNLTAEVAVLKEGCDTFDAPYHNAEKLNAAALEIMSGSGIKII